MKVNRVVDEKNWQDEYIHVQHPDVESNFRKDTRLVWTNEDNPDYSKIRTAGGLYGRLTPKLVEKSWGHEEIFINIPDLYCMKALYFNPGMGTSKHFHCSKHESFFVSKGRILVLLYNKGIVNNNIILEEGDSFVVPPGLVHAIYNAGEVEACMIEASTFSRDLDSNRID